MGRNSSPFPPRPFPNPTPPTTSESGIGESAGAGVQVISGGSAGAWGQASTAEYSGAGSPVGVVTPSAAGDLYVDTTDIAVWQATGLANTDWQLGTAWGAANSASLSGSGSPVGQATPYKEGDLYVDVQTPGLWQATGLANTDWEQVGGSSPVNVATVTLSSAEVLALSPTVFSTLVAGVSGKVIIPLTITSFASNGGDYTFSSNLLVGWRTSFPNGATSDNLGGLKDALTNALGSGTSFGIDDAYSFQFESNIGNDGDAADYVGQDLVLGTLADSPTGGTGEATISVLYQLVTAPA